MDLFRSSDSLHNLHVKNSPFMLHGPSTRPSHVWQLAKYACQIVSIRTSTCGQECGSLKAVEYVRGGGAFLRMDGAALVPEANRGWAGDRQVNSA